MARRSDSSLAALLLSQRLVDASTAPLSAAEHCALLARVDDPAVLLGRTAESLAHELDDVELAARISGRMEAATALAFELERLEQAGVRVVTIVDDDYPPRLVSLGPKAPPILHVVGPCRLMAMDLLGVVGSRDVSPEGAAIARAAARAALSHGCGVVSGGARGVDRLAMNAATEAGGVAVGLLADSLVHTIKEPELRRLVGEDQVCLATPFAPSMGFTAANAMARNKLIYALAQRTFVVASNHEQGGTWAGAKEALGKSLRLPVDVWTGEGGGPGNAALVERGARPVTEVAQLWEAVETSPAADSAPAPDAEAEQLHLGV